MRDFSHAYIDMLCFDYGNRNERPGVVLWKAEKAQEEFVRWEKQLDAEEDEDADPPVDYDSFIVPVAENFTEFALKLKAVPE